MAKKTIISEGRFLMEGKIKMAFRLYIDNKIYFIY
jgi:hypothetical protein